MYGRFLVAYYIQRPRDKSKSHLKDSSKTNLGTDEQIGFAIKLTDKDILKADVVLDLDNKKVLRAKFNSVTKSLATPHNDFNKLYSFYYNIYYKEIDKFMGKTEE